MAKVKGAITDSQGLFAKTGAYVDEGIAWLWEELRELKGNRARLERTDHANRTQGTNTSSRRNRTGGSHSEDRDGRDRGQREVGPRPVGTSGRESARRIHDGGSAQRTSAQGSAEAVGVMAPIPPLVPPSETAPFPAVQIANTFVDRFGADNVLTHMKLQKLVFYTYGWWLALSEGSPSISTSRPQVWKLGPVFQPIYGEFAKFQNQRVDELQPLGPFSPAATVAREDESRESQIIDWIWNRYGHFTAFQLSDLTHKPGTPWYNIAKEHKFEVPRFLEMEDDQIRPFFVDLGQKEGIIRQLATG